MSGVSSSEDAIIDLIEEVNEDPANLQNCGGGGDGCKMATFIVGCIVAGSIVFPILTFLVCCGFCCGRKCCKCCGKPCCAAKCGGEYPTREYKLIEVILVGVVLCACILILLVFSSLGYQSLSEMKGDYDDVLDAGLELARTPGAIVADTTLAVDDIKLAGLRSFGAVNAEFDVIGDVRVINARLNASIVALRSELLALQWLVEGCDAGSGTCVIPAILPTTLPAIVNPCVSGSHPVGIGALLSSSRVNPACRNPQDTADVACPCCTRCHVILADLAEVQGQLSTDADLDSLNTTLDLGAIDSTIDEAMGDWDASLTDFEETLQPVEDGVEEAKKAVTSDQVDGIAAGIFLLSWLILICVIAAAILSVLQPSGIDDNKSKALGIAGAYLWWGAFIVCVIYVVVIVLPVFGWITAIALPFETVCSILPAQGEDAGDLFRLLEAADSSVDDTVRTLINECVLPPNGYIWPSANISKASLTSDVAGEFNVSEQLASVDVDGTLDANAQTAAYNQSEVDALQASDYGVASACPAAIAGSPQCGVYLADMASYESDLQARIASVKAVSANVSAAISALKAVSASTKDRINNIKVIADAAVVDIIDRIWEIGSCTRISAAYEGLRSPLCDGVAAGLFGTWGALFIMAFFLYLLLFLINKSAKMALNRREPKGDPRLLDDNNKVHPEPGGGDGVTPGSNPAQAPQAPVAEVPDEKPYHNQEAT